MDVNLDPVVLLRAGYLSASILVLLIFAIPPLRTRFLDYGPRNDTTSPPRGRRSGNILIVLLDYVASLRVPHRWFTSFYATSVLASLVWALQIASGFDSNALAMNVSTQAHAMTFRQVIIVWSMMFAQGSRRLYECLAISKPSNSRMWFGHWVLGVLFYLATSVAIWVEGIRKVIRQIRTCSVNLTMFQASIEKHTITFTDLVFQAPDIRTFLGFTLFLLASGFQHDCHAYLASLKEPRKTDPTDNKPGYRLPEHPAFNISVTPHYFAECLIYLSLATVAAPPGDWFNWTLVTALVFVVVNLGVTALGTKLWYEQKFGPESVRGKARMIPFVF